MPFAREGLSLQPKSGRLLPTAPNFKRIMTHKRTLSTFLLAVLAVLAVSAQSAREVLDAALVKCVPAKKQHLLEPNRKAMQMGIDLAE